MERVSPVLRVSIKNCPPCLPLTSDPCAACSRAATAPEYKVVGV
jgi:hypothetical protein